LISFKRETGIACLFLHCRLKASKNVRLEREGRQMNPHEGHLIRRLPASVLRGAKKKGS